MKEFDPDSLAEFNGENGKPIYIAYQGKVYDVTESKMWRGGLHMKRHHAGRDLTTDIKAAPHTPEVLERYPQIGVVKKQEPILEQEIPEKLQKLLNTFPFLRRHPHPMTVHFPISFLLAAPFFTLLYLVTGIKTLDTTAIHLLGLGILSAGVAISTGWYTWWLNYFAKPLRPVNIKKPLSLFTMCLSFILYIWRLFSPNLLESMGAASVMYLIMLFSIVPILMIIGWFGASMTFPVEEE
jgi:predicted heme/steroid binding protein/uncharacterized membrane protein